MDTGSKQTVKAGDILIQQGSPGDCAYIIEQGQVEILIEKPNGSIQTVGTRGPGTIIGEMALIDQAPRTATVKAVEDCELLVITQQDFSRRLKSADPIIQSVTGVILTRFRDVLARSSIMSESVSFPPTESVEKSFFENTDAMERIKLANEFKVALETRQLSLNYQPIVNFHTGQVGGFEALMRWHHPERGYISPAVFIPIAEESGLIVDASKWALRESCLALKRIEGRVGHDRDLYMSVNFSSRDFAEETFLEDLYEIISRSDVEPRQIQLEITESLLMAQPEIARNTLSLCQKAGLNIAIDDFGTGYSSLSYLHYFPIDSLKIDQMFVRDFLKKDKSLELIRAIIGLGQNMSMKVLAEGIETEEEARKLYELGCDMGQGYFFAKPLPEREVSEVLVNWRPIKLGA